MAKKKNTYSKNARKKSALAGITQTLETKGDLKNTAIETAKDLIVGVFGGGIVGAALGRTSLLVGTAINGIGHYTKSRIASVFGIGMMASNGFQKPADQVTGTEKQGILDGVKERLLAYKDSFLTKLYVDKIMKKKQQPSDDGASGVGEVKYFVYPGNKNKEIDLSELERIENQVAESAKQFAEKQQAAGLNGTVEIIDPEEMNY